MSGLSVEECSFCSEFNGQVENNLLLRFVGPEVKSRIVKQTPIFVVLPTIGHLVEGYLLVLPRMHYTSFGHLPPCLVEEFQKLKQEVRSVLFSECHVPPIVFEHGPVSETRRGGSSVDHAHMHFVPAPVDLLPTIRSNFGGRPIDSLVELRGPISRGVPYLYYEDASGQGYVFDAPHVPSQYLRRLVAEQLNTPDKWNWLTFPEVDVLKTTIARFKMTWE